MTAKRYRATAALMTAALVAASCHSPSGTAARPPAPSGPPTMSAATTTSAAATTTTTVSATTATAPATTAATTTTTTSAARPAFTDRVSAVSASDLPYTWRTGCPVAPAQLRLIHLTYWGFDHRAHTGAIVVNQAVVTGVVNVFRTLYTNRFEIAQMVPEDAYRGDDNAAAAADDTSGFNCRDAVAPGPPQWSVHAYGEAIDVNDVQNPYLDGSIIIPPSGRAYLNRSQVRPGMAYYGGVLVQAFAAAGWYWGGRWSPGTDYQHFSLTGG